MRHTKSYSFLRFSPMGKVTDALASLIGRIPTRTAFLLAWLATWTVPASAVGDGSAGLVQATQMVTGYF